MAGPLPFAALALLAASLSTMPAAGSTLLLAQTREDGGSSVRQIAPDIVAPPTVDPGELEREAPRAPLSDLGTAGPPERKSPTPAEAERAAAETAKPQIRRPVAAAAGRIEADGLTIVIVGIDIVEPEQTCQGANGTWPCGMAARTAFRSFLRGRALDCDLPDGERPERVAASCRLGTQDLGAWLVGNGWAKVSSTGPYADEQARAVEGRRGIFGPGPGSLPQAPEPATGTAPEAREGTAPDARPPNAEPAPSGIERRPLPEPKGLY